TSPLRYACGEAPHLDPPLLFASLRVGRGPNRPTAQQSETAHERSECEPQRAQRANSARAKRVQNSARAKRVQNSARAKPGAELRTSEAGRRLEEIELFAAAAALSRDVGLRARREAKALAVG